MNTDTLKELRALLASYEKPGNSNIDFASRIKKILAIAKQEESQKIICVNCDGSGKARGLVDKHGNNVECPNCEGKGYRPEKPTADNGPQKLKPCPMCGSEAVMVRVRNEYFPLCKSNTGKGMCLLAQGPYKEDGFKYESDAIEIWNKRYTPTEPRPQEQGLVEELKKLIEDSNASAMYGIEYSHLQEIVDKYSRPSSPVKEEHATDKENTK